MHVDSIRQIVRAHRGPYRFRLASGEVIEAPDRDWVLLAPPQAGTMKDCIILFDSAGQLRYVAAALISEVQGGDRVQAA